MENYNYNCEFWNYCGIKIPMTIHWVPSTDRINDVYKDGSITEMYSDQKPYTIKEYQDIYSVVGSDNQLYWKKSSVDEPQQISASKQRISTMHGFNDPFANININNLDMDDLYNKHRMLEAKIDAIGRKIDSNTTDVEDLGCKLLELHDPFANIFATPAADDNCNSEFWNYCGIQIPMTINCVPSKDRTNTVYKRGSETEAYSNLKPYTIKEYQDIYSVVGSDNKLYWKE
jgi:hypothetical protein